MGGGLTAEGVILRRYILRETSYILVIFTREYGKIRGVIKGVRNPCPQFSGNFETFSRVSVRFYKKKKSPLDLITHCESLEYFGNVRNDIERLTYASYFIELVDTVTVDNDENPELYKILVASIRMLTPGAGCKRVSRIFELKTLSAVGLEPMMGQCVSCASGEPEKFFFDVASGGVLCCKCSKSSGSVIPVSRGTVKFINKIQENDITRTGQFKVSREVGIETEKILNAFVRFHINRPLKSMKFMDDLRRAGIVKV